MLSQARLRGLVHLRRCISTSCPRPSGSDPNNPYPEDKKMEKQPIDYRPGSDFYDYENPWPKFNKGKLDWMFGDGWRRPVAMEQGQRMRRKWIPFGLDSHDEYKDWYHWHWMWAFGTICFVVVPLGFGILRPDWPGARDWARREAYLEIARRQAQGLPLISPDLVDRSKVQSTLPSEEELKNFYILI